MPIGLMARISAQGLIVSHPTRVQSSPVTIRLALAGVLMAVMARV
jgi:hypothetical protein